MMVSVTANSNQTVLSRLISHGFHLKFACNAYALQNYLFNNGIPNDNGIKTAIIN